VAKNADVVFADAVEFVDRGETIRCRCVCHQPEGEVWVLMPRSAFLTALVAAMERFAPGAGEPPRLN